MKLSPFVIGVISAQGSGDYDYGSDDDRHTGYYGGGSSGSSWSGMGSSNWNYGTGAGRATEHATAVTCWESNNMGSHNTHHNHFSDMNDLYGWDNVHQGHETSVGTFNGAFNTQGGEVDYHSALAFDHRLSGCIYEMTGWDFTAQTYNKVHLMTYGTLFTAVGYDTNNGNIFPVWWHYFNAHVMAGGNTHQHGLVMANPTYEGLGYLNFIVTFLKGTQAGTGERDPTLVDTNIDDNKHTDLYSNGDAFELVTDTATTCDFASLGTAACFMSAYEVGDTGSENWDNAKGGLKLAMSSFPHNDLGKDFRFNLRMMHHLGEGDSTEFFDSYYFYRVNTITIAFPHTVSCPYEQKWDAGAGTATMHKCMDSAGYNGHQMHNGANGTPQVNVAMFTESLTDSTTQAPTDYPACCSAAPAIGKHSCGETYTVNGLMNMYDEYAQQEYGTHQELWFQFYYKYGHTGNSHVADDSHTGIYNYPNKLFNSFEVLTITGSCSAGSGNGVYNGNQCTGGANDNISEENWSENVQSGR